MKEKLQKKLTSLEMSVKNLSFYEIGIFYSIKEYVDGALLVDYREFINSLSRMNQYSLATYLQEKMDSPVYRLLSKWRDGKLLEEELVENPDLPAEMWHGIFQYLSVKDLSSAAKTCNFFKEITSDNKLWINAPTDRFDHLNNSARMIPFEHSSLFTFTSKSKVLKNGLIARWDGSEVLLFQGMHSAKPIRLVQPSSNIKEVESLSANFLALLYRNELSQTDSISIWDLHNACRREIDYLKPHSIATCHQNGLLAIATENCDILIWDLKSKQTRFLYNPRGIVPNAVIKKMSIVNGKIITLTEGSVFHYLEIRDIVTGYFLRSIGGLHKTDSFAILPNGNLAITKFKKLLNTGIVEIYDLNIEEPIRKVSGDWTNKTCIPLQDMQILIENSKTGTFKVIDLALEDKYLISQLPFSFKSNLKILRLDDSDLLFIPENEEAKICRFPHLLAKVKDDGTYYLPQSNDEENLACGYYTK